MKEEDELWTSSEALYPCLPLHTSALPQFLKEFPSVEMSDKEETFQCVGQSLLNVNAVFLELRVC